MTRTSASTPQRPPCSVTSYIGIQSLTGSGTRMFSDSTQKWWKPTGRATCANKSRSSRPEQSMKLKSFLIHKRQRSSTVLWTRTKSLWRGRRTRRVRLFAELRTTCLHPSMSAQNTEKPWSQTSWRTGWRLARTANSMLSSRPARSLKPSSTTGSSPRSIRSLQ